MRLPRRHTVPCFAGGIGLLARRSSCTISPYFVDLINLLSTTANSNLLGLAFRNIMFPPLVPSWTNRRGLKQRMQSEYPQKDQRYSTGLPFRIALHLFRGVKHIFFRYAGNLFFSIDLLIDLRIRPVERSIQMLFAITVSIHFGINPFKLLLASAWAAIQSKAFVPE